MPQVYDPDKTEADSTSIPPSDEGRRHSQKMQEQAEGSGSAPPSPEVLEHAERTGGKATPTAEPSSEFEQLGRHENTVGSGYKPGKNGSLRSRLFKTRRRTALIGASAAAAVVAIAIFTFLALLPLKVLHIVNNVQNHFFSATENATEKATERLVQKYVQKHVLRSLNGTTCRSTLSPACRTVVPQGGNPVTHLYRAWANNRFENRLATKYGIEFKYDGKGVYYLKGPGLPRDINITDFQDGRVDDLFDSSDFRRLESSNQFRNALKQHMRTATAGETRWKATMYRYKVTRLAHAKTGIPLCIIACQSRDNFNDWKRDQKSKALRFALTKGVIAPRDEVTRLVIECLFDKSCDMELREGPRQQLDESGKCISNCLDKGKYITGFETNMRARIIAAAGGPGLTAASELARAEKLYNDISASRSYSEYVLRTIIANQLINSGDKNSDAKARALSQRITNVVPLVGWVLFLGDIAYTAEFLSKYGAEIGYLVNSSSMIGVFQEYRVYADEIKTGNVDADMVGSFVDSLGPSRSADIGGNAGAEQSPLYDVVVGKETIGGAQIGYNDALGNKAYAQELVYRCENGARPHQGPTCIEEKLNQRTKSQQFYENEVNSSFDKKFVNYSFVKVGEASQAIIDQGIDSFCRVTVIVCLIVGPVLERVFSFMTDQLRHVPGFEELAEYLGNLFSDLFLPKNPISPNMSGGRAFNMIAGGADVLANETAHHTLGGVKLSKAQLDEISAEHKQSQIAQYQNQPFLARILDKESPYSPVSKLALALPSKPADAAKSTFASFISNPVGKLLHSFSAVFNIGWNPARVTAQPPAAGCDSERYSFDTSGNGLYYWSADPDVDTHGGIMVSNSPDGTYSVHFRDRPGREGQTQGSTESYMAPGYCDPGGGDPFGVSQYGYPQDNPIFKEDLEQYYQANCMDNTKTIGWNAKAAADENKITGQPENLFDSSDKYQGTNPCLLIQAAVSSAGAVFDETLLSPEELAETGSAVGDGSSTVSGDAQQVAQQILDNPNIDLRASNFCRYCQEDIRNTAEGRPAYGSVRLDINLLKFLLELGQAGRVDVNSITGAGSGHSPTSNHYRGTAVDFACSLNVATADSIAKKYGISRYIGERCPDDGHWHYSTTGS